MNKNDQDYLNNLRHSAAHLLAAAVMDLWPDAKYANGPAIENGFYHDFDFKEPISASNLEKIEQKMHELVQTWSEFSKKELTKDEALEFYKENEYKKELVNEFSNDGKKLSFYKSGEYDCLCKGGHIDKPAEEIKYFKLLKLAGAYWRGDEKNPMLTRIYGTAFPTQKELDEYLEMIEEAKKRDHRKLGVQFDLFTFSDKVGGGLPLWTPKGTLIRNLLDHFVWSLRKEKGYQKVEIPHIAKKDLYETSGHWDKFSDELFHITTREGHKFVMKPMNCPHHTQIYARKPHSYKELPQRYANTTMVYRDEQSGELSGLSRVRSITQDDAHVFCRESQVENEALAIWDIIERFYKGCGFEKLSYRLSLHDPNEMDKYLGNEEEWKRAEDQLRNLLEKKGVEYFDGVGEAAFYGPKIDIMSKDSIGRTWQVATIQVDRNIPKRFELSFVNEEGANEQVVMLHAAIMGSIERFLSVLIEHFAGAFPVWLSPVQVKILPITDRNLDYALSVANKLKEAGIRVEIDEDSETLGNKIRKAQEEKVPYMIIIGDKEENDKKIAVRLRNGKDLGAATLESFVKDIQEKIQTKTLEL